MNKEEKVLKELNDYKVKYIDKCAELDIKKAELVSALKSSAEKRQRINKAIEYIEKVKTLAQIDKVCILSISTLENILKGSEE